MSFINVIGASCIDILLDNIDKSQFFSGKYKADSIKTFYGGDALNETMVLNHFGYDAKLITVLGNDIYGKLIINHLEENNIFYNSNILKEDIDTYISLVLVDEKGERVFVGSKSGSVRKLELEDINVDDDCKIVSFASLFISPELNDDKLQILFKDIKDRNKILCVDCSTPKNNETVKDLKSLKYIDYFFANQSEAKAITGRDNLSEMEKILLDNGIKNVIIKCGKDGCYHGGRYYRTDSIDPIDTTGAGDSFVAGFISGLSDNLDIDKCIERANMFGYKACLSQGAATWLNSVEKDFYLI